MKTALLITFSQTVRVICESNEPTEDELVDACIQAQEVMALNGPIASLTSCIEDKESPFENVDDIPETLFQSPNI